MPSVSFVERLLQAKGSLPPMRRRIFDVVYQQGRKRRDAAQELGLSQAEFDREHDAMLRSLRGAAAST